jgi:hypothetical protein
MLLDQMPDPAGKAFKTAQRVDLDGVNGGMLSDNGRVFAKAKVDDLPTGIGGGLQKRPHEAAIIFEVWDAPEHVVTDPKPIQNLVQPAQPGGDPVFRLERFLITHGRIR